MADIQGLPMLNDTDADCSPSPRRGGKGGSSPRERQPPAATQASSIRHMLVGSMLRSYREAAGYKLDDAARILECDRSKISRVETGQRGIRPKELCELLTEYGVAAAAQDTLTALARPRDANAWWRDYRRLLPDGYLDFAVAEGVASRILVYAPLQVPELLWTPEYGQAVTAVDPTVPEDAEEIAVEAAVAYRGGTFFERQPDCTVILGEAALHHRIGSPDVMRAQLAHVARLSGPDYPWLTIRVLPFSAGTCSGAGECSILQFSELSDMGLVHVAGPHGGICLSEPPVVDAYTTIFRRMNSLSLNPEQSTRRLRRAPAADSRPTGMLTGSRMVGER
jgi:transcriptional regulator with XRE-family HTH domain